MPVEGVFGPDGKRFTCPARDGSGKRGIAVIRMPSQGVKWFSAVCVCLLLGSAAITTSAAQDKKTTQTAGVDNTKMGAYRALAQLSFQAFQKGDTATAAELARILERTWDNGEERGGEQCLIKTNKGLFEEIDKAMDGFIKPILQYATKVPDPAAVQAAYNDFLEKLKQAD